MKIVRSSSLTFVPASHEDPRNPGSLKKVLFIKDQLIDGRVQMINWALLPSGKSFQRHYHEDMEEVFIILKGTVEIEIDGEQDTLSSGDAVLIPVAGKHRMKAVSSTDVEYIAMGISTQRGGKTVVVDT